MPQPEGGDPPSGSGAAQRRRASALLLDLARAWPADRISIGDLLTALGDRGYGLVMLALALPNLIPVPIPGLSGILGTPIIILALMMLAGYPEPVLPKLVRDRTFPRAGLEAVMLKAEPWLKRLEGLTRPGTLRLPNRAVEIPAALLLAVNAVLLALPIPFGNPAPALAIVLTSVALIEADRRMFLIAILVMLVAIAIDVAIVLLLVGIGKAVADYL